jgi:excisionase family DNA binding protein
MKDYLLPSQAAKLLDKSKVTVIRWIHCGKFENIRKVGDEFRIPLVSFNKFIESTKFKPKYNG